MLQAPKCSSPPPPPFQRQLWSLKEHVPSMRTPGGPPLWVVVHVVVKCIEGLYELWRMREMYTLTQVERHRALTTKLWKALGDSGRSSTRWIHLCLAHSTFLDEKWRTRGGRLLGCGTRLPPPSPLPALRAHLVAKGQQLLVIHMVAPKAPEIFFFIPLAHLCPLCTPTLSLNPTLTLMPTATLSLLLTLPTNLRPFRSVIFFSSIDPQVALRAMSGLA